MRRIKAVLRLVTVAAVVAVLASTIQIGGAFAATSSSPNLIVNPGAEAGAGSSNGVSFRPFLAGAHGVHVHGGEVRCNRGFPDQIQSGSCQPWKELLRRRARRN